MRLHTEVEGSGEGAEELLTAEEVPLAYETLPPPKQEPQAAPSQAEEVDAEAPTSPAEPLPKEEPQSAEREEPPQQDSQVQQFNDDHREGGVLGGGFHFSF